MKLHLRASKTVRFCYLTLLLLTLFTVALPGVSSTLLPVKGYACSPSDPASFSSCTSEGFSNENEQRDNLFSNTGPWSKLIKRVVGIHYANDVHRGVLTQENYPAPLYNNDNNLCGKPHTGEIKHENTVFYHNCDIPSVVTEFVQSLSELFLPLGVYTTGLNQPYLSPLFRPSGIPDDKVPANPEERFNKYTGLELYGYHLPLTVYAGEWDGIEVSTGGRMLTNTTLGTKVEALAMGAWQGLKGAVSSAWAFLAGYPPEETGVTNIANSLLDTSDINVATSYAWSRPSWSKNRMYGAVWIPSSERELSGVALLQGLGERTKEQKGVAPAEVEAFINPPRMSQEVCSAAATFNPETGKCSDGNTPRSEEERFTEWRNHIEAMQRKLKPEWGLTIPVLPASPSGIPAWSKETASKATQAAAELKKKDKEEKSERHFDKLLESWLSDFDSDQNNPSSFYGCISHGVPQFNGVLHKKAYDKQGNLQAGCDQPRPPIENGLFGNGLTAQQAAGYIPDGRWTFYSEHPWYQVYITEAAATATAQLLSITGDVTAYTNLLLDLSFQPILEKLGINQLVTQWTELLRDTVFLPLIELGIILTGFYLLFLLFKGKIRESLTQVGTLFLVVIIGTAILVNPGKVLQQAESVASAGEALISNVLLTGQKSELCSTGRSLTPGSSDWFDYHKTARETECQVWQAFVFAPYINLQWGDNYNKVGTELNKATTPFTGSPAVNMGGSKENNWALKQLEYLTKGSITERAKTGSLTTPPSDIYRLVDIQAGPADGYQRTSTYLEHWGTGAGQIFGGVLTLIVAIIGLLVIGYLAILKIAYTFAFTISFLLLPAILVKGLAPSTNAKRKLWLYLANLGSLLLARVILLVMLLLTVMLVTATYESPNSLYLNAFLAIAVLLLIWNNRETLVTVFGDLTVGKLKERLSGVKLALGNTSIGQKAASVTSGWKAAAGVAATDLALQGSINRERVATVRQQQAARFDRRARNQGYAPLRKAFRYNKAINQAQTAKKEEIVTAAKQQVQAEYLEKLSENFNQRILPIVQQNEDKLNATILEQVRKAEAVISKAQAEPLNKRLHNRALARYQEVKAELQRLGYNVEEGE